MDGWFNDEEDCSQPSCSSASPCQSLSDLRRRPFCEVGAGCVPGFACKEGLPSLEVHKPQLMNSPSTPTHRQLYQINMQMGIGNKLNEGSVQQPSQLGEFFHADNSLPSSSSTSLRSLSGGSPEFPSLILSRTSSTTSSRMPDIANFKETSIEQVILHPRSASVVPPHQLAMHIYGQTRHIQPLTPISDVDAAMTRAMLAVISSPSSCSPQQSQCWGGAFQPYDTSPTPKVEALQVSQEEQETILKQMRSTSSETQLQETRPNSNQSNHVMSERKRREKLNESFVALRSSLPPGTKNDKASVLSSTIDYVKSLNKEISELEGKNRLMEARLLPLEETQDGDDARGERVRIKIVKAAESSSDFQKIELRVIARVEYLDMIDLVLRILECLKNTRGVSLASLDAGVQCPQTNPIRRAILTMQIKGGDWDEDWFKGAIARAVDEAASLRPESAAP